MGTVNANFLPATTGLNLGSQNQQWNAYLNLVNGGSPVNMSVTAVPWTASPAFVTTSLLTIVTMLLTGNVSSSTFTGAPGLVIFQLTQDSTGGRTFSWPTNFLQPSIPGRAANQATMQMFFYDGTNAWPLGPAVVYP